MRHSGVAGIGVAVEVAGNAGLHAAADRRAAIGEGDGVAEDDLPAMRRECHARDKHDAAVGGKLLVLSAVYRPEQ